MTPLSYPLIWRHPAVQHLTAQLLRKARMLPFAERYTIVPVLFLKNKPKDASQTKVLLPQDVMELMSIFIENSVNSRLRRKSESLRRKSEK